MAVFRAMTDTPQPIPRAVVHYSKHDPLHHVGGVETRHVIARRQRLRVKELG